VAGDVERGVPLEGVLGVDLDAEDVEILSVRGMLVVSIELVSTIPVVGSMPPVRHWHSATGHVSDDV
jgi:hypothetical protein